MFNITDEQWAVLKEYGITCKTEDLDDLLLDLDAKITEIGFKRDYSLNDVGRKLQLLYDRIYVQNEYPEIYWNKKN